MKKIYCTLAFVFLVNFVAVAQFQLSSEFLGKFKLTAEAKHPKIAFNARNFPADFENNLMTEDDKKFWFGKSTYEAQNRQHTEVRPIAKIALSNELVALIAIQSTQEQARNGLSVVWVMNIYNTRDGLRKNGHLEAFSSEDIKIPLTLPAVYEQMKKMKVSFTHEEPLTFEVKKGNETKVYALNQYKLFKEVKK